MPAGILVDLGTEGALTGATFNIADGDSVALNSGTFAGAVFNVGQDATLDLTGGQTVTSSGIFSGTGGGTVSLGGGTLDVGQEGGFV